MILKMKGWIVSMTNKMDMLFEEISFSKEEREAFFDILAISKMSISGEISDVVPRTQSIIEELFKNDN